MNQTELMALETIKERLHKARGNNMKFNRVIWDALCYAATNSPTFEVDIKGFHAATAVKALAQYAAACDGTLHLAEPYRTFEFIPNPIPRY
jgi:hypothetical protein